MRSPVVRAAMWLLLVSATLAGCAYTKLKEPHLQVIDVDLVSGNLMSQQLRVRLRVDNPNDRELPIKGISYAIELAGQEFAHGNSESNFVVPANGNTEFDVGVTANAAAALLKLLGGGAKLDNVGYRITGKVQLSSGLLRSIPFAHDGQLKLK